MVEEYMQRLVFIINMMYKISVDVEVLDGE